MKKILYTFFLLGSLLLFANVSFAQVGTYTLTGSDSFGDGWNGASVQIITSSGVTNWGGPAAAGPESISFSVTNGETVMICETAPGGFPFEISYFVTGPTGDMPVNVTLGNFVGGGGCASFVAVVPPPADCGDDQCALDVTLNLNIVGNNFGGGWSGSTLDVTVNGETNDVNTLTADIPATYVYQSVCLDILESTDIIVDFTDNSTFQDDHVGWEIVVSPGLVVDDPMDLLLNEGGGLTNQGDLTTSGTITVTCPEPTPTPAPEVTCGIYEIGKTGFLQAPSATAECPNGFNCEVAAAESCPAATLFTAGATLAATVPSNGIPLADGTIGTFTVPAAADPAAVFLGISYELCATGDFDFTTEIVEFFANGVSLGEIGSTGSQCANETCITVADCGTNAIGDVITITTEDVNNNAGFCAASISVTPTFNYSGAPSEDAFACITWYASETATDVLFVGNELPVAIVQEQIANGSLPESLLCHEQIATFFVTTSCGPTESDRVPVNLFVFNPCADGCANYLELTDGGGDGWEGAKLMVSVNEGTSEEVKLSAAEGGCKVIQYCLNDGETLDLQYWEGADNEEHGYNVISFDGTVLLAEGPGPSTEVNRVTASCPDVACAGTIVDATVRVTIGGDPEEVSWQIYDGSDNPSCQGPLVFGINANTYAGFAPGTQFTHPVQLEACSEYTFSFFSGGVDGTGATFEVISSDIDYGTEILNPNDPFFGQSVALVITDADLSNPAEGRVSFTLPCKPACVDAVSTVLLGNCFAEATVLPIAAPEVCYPDCNHATGCEIQVRHTILNDGNDRNIAFQSAFTPIGDLTEVDYTATQGFQMSAGCHSYVTEYLYCDGVVTKCTSAYTVVPQETSSFTCNDNVIVPLRTPDGIPNNGGANNAQFDDLGECVIQITADMVIEAGVGAPANINCEFFNINDFYEVVILDANDQPLVVLSGNDLPLDSNGSEILPGQNTIPANNFVSYNEIKQTLKYVITHKVTGTTCWGTLTVEDKNAPTIGTTGYDVNCNDPNILNEFFSETNTFESGAADEYPVNISGGNGATPSSSWLPFTLPCGRLGTVIQDIQVTVAITHNDPGDLSVELHIPTDFNNSLVAPFPGGILTLDTQGDVGSATNVYTPNPNNDSPALLGLLGASCKEYESSKDVDFASETTGNTLPQGHGKTWYLRVVDSNDTEFIDPFGGGEITDASITITCGYPFPYGAFDCALDNVELISEVLDEACGSAAVVRVWKATDSCGQSSTSTQVVNILRPSIADLALPSEEVLIECGTEQLDANGDIDPAQSGSPAFCCDQVTDEDLCKISLTYSDEVLNSCGNSTKILRTWSVLNWCTPTNTPTTLTQLIVVGDTTGPVIDTDGTITINGDANCEGSLSLADLDVTDACGDVTALRLEYTTGSTYTGNSTTNIFDLLAGDMVDGLPMGSTNATITATDECGNNTTLTVALNVVDGSAPTAICDDQLNIALNSDGVARVFATDFDEGSNDNCSDVTVEIRSLGSLGAGFGEFADFGCADLGSVRVELLVTDAAGNTNLCWADLLVEDPIGPTIECKPDVTVTCDEALNAENVFAEPDATDNCGVSIEAGDIVSVDLPNCGQLLTRSYTATDGSDKSDDASCSQTVTVVHVSDFIVQFPGDEEFDNCELGNIPGPIVTEDDCEQVAISTEDRIFVQVDDACYKIERTYTIINHCIVDDPSAGGFTDLGTPLPIPNTFRDDDGYFQYTQIIKVTDTEAPVITFTAPDPCDFTDGCEGESVLTATAEDNCADVASVELSYEIDAFGDGTFDISGNGNDATGIYPYGDHIIRWIATDGCGNVTAEDYAFSVEDCKNPTPKCNGLTTVVMNNGGCVSVEASHLLESAFDNCTERSTEEWQDNARVRREGDNGALSTSVELCCADVADGAVNVEVWIEDEAGNAEFCVVALIIQDSDNYCATGTGASAPISGMTATEFDNRVQDVEVAINSDVVMTDIDGIYTTTQPTETMYNVAPEKLTEVAEGISTFDLVLMAQHVLQINELTTPYQLIAADVTNDAKIDIFDMVELRSLILFSITEFSNNTSWRFVDASYSFQNPTAPWTEDYPQSIEVMLEGATLNQDFVAVKIGDLDGDAAAPLTGVNAEERNASTLTMVIDDVEMAAGNDYKVDFRASDFNDVTGYQFTLNFDQNAADFVSVEAGALNVDESNFGFTMLDEGIITTSFTEMGRAISVENDEVLFSINFSARANATLTDVIGLTNQYTVAEAYNTESEVSDVKLAFNNAGLVSTIGGEFELFQNKPNPFSEFTTVGFNLPEATTATLRIYDVSGKTLKVFTTDAARGYNEVNVNRSDLGAAGVLYYQLDTDTDSAVKKMIILE